MTPNQTNSTTLHTHWPRPMRTFPKRWITLAALLRLYPRRPWMYLQKMRSLPIIRSCCNSRQIGTRLAGLNSAPATFLAPRDTSKRPGKLQVPFRAKFQANFVSANFLISVSNGHKSNDAVFLSGAEELRNAIAALAALKYPQSFPDDTPTRVIRKAILSCSIYSKNCTLVLILPTDAAVPVPFRVPSPTNPG